MQYKIILTRTYVTEFDVDANDEKQARKQFEMMGDEIYRKELEQCNVIDEKIIVQSDDDSIRVCSVTGEEMTEGWVVNDGELYFKYEKDALAWCKSQEYEDINSAYNDDVIYWTEWE